jgi:hypothetical protein
MSNYITRVQLKHAGQEDYERLDIEMEKGLFVRVGRAGDADVREYNHRRGTSLQAVITAAYVAAGRIGKQYSLTVMKEKRLIQA